MTEDIYKFHQPHISAYMCTRAVKEKNFNFKTYTLVLKIKKKNYFRGCSLDLHSF